MHHPARPPLDPRVLHWGRRILDPLRRYHGYRAVGLENIPREGPAIVAVSHSLATYDGFLLGLAVIDGTGRTMVGLGDDLIFKIPGLGSLAEMSSLRPANPENARALLAEGHLLGVAPGGMRESLRPSTERYAVRWQKRRGFVRLALETGTPIILAACPAADDIYEVFESPVTKIAYRHLKVPVPIARGLGPTPLPRPVRLTHHIGEPIVPPALDPENREAQVEALHTRVVAEMEALMERGRAEG